MAWLPIARVISRRSTIYYCHNAATMPFAKSLHPHITIIKSSLHQASKFNQELLTPSDPELLFTNVPGKYLGLTSTNHFNVSYTDENSTSPLVTLVVHGCPGSHLDFRYISSVLVPAGVRVIRLNMPGFGSSEKPPEFIYSAHNLAKFVAAFLDNIGVTKINMAVGISFGCSIVTSLSTVQPNLVLSYGLLSSVGGRPHAGLRPYFSKDG
ncbi:uncharacterized protein TRIADDRAFT_61964 [Trichoplax adhaerens]|uniref:AB hydrolase-1 domain-containing protein n=1 Tax=Trichoplax adhaerens TaxID=10228 RepID=B3SCG7_TRIAD|nr:hypothetical protein TRIADDRAFT_61964 [Trichoplax adhaerens]EDV19613.1 hypothetical protein TRIADDRAFT_61964 [Trichoplax adhaerens]|eukprot:XP_002117946.1 hypothetical protein TRIADDRAFT_61964 [Trichoplax adhaerens]